MFHIAQQGNVHHNAAQRSEETKSLLPEQLSAGQIERICKMIYGNESSRSVGKKCAKMFAEFGMPNGEFVELPDEIAGASFETLISVDQVRNIFLYLRARRARHKIMKYITTKYPDLEYPVDVMHNLGAAAHGWSKAIIMIRELTKTQPNMEQEEDISQKYFLKNPIIPFVLRVPIIRTTFDGVFPRDDPLIPGRSIVVCDIKEAAIMSNDVRFLFGTGVDERQCPFKDLFLSSTDQALKLKHKATL